MWNIVLRKFIISFISTLPLFMSPEDTREYPNSIRYAFLPYLMNGDLEKIVAMKNR